MIKMKVGINQRILWAAMKIISLVQKLTGKAREKRGENNLPRENYCSKFELTLLGGYTNKCDGAVYQCDNIIEKKIMLKLLSISGT